MGKKTHILALSHPFLKYFFWRFSAQGGGGTPHREKNRVFKTGHKLKPLDEEYNLVYLVSKKARILRSPRIETQILQWRFLLKILCSPTILLTCTTTFLSCLRSLKRLLTGAFHLQCNRTIRAMKANLRRKIPRKYFQFRTFQFHLQGRGQSLAGSEVSTSLLTRNCKMSILDHSSIFCQ